MKAGRAADFFGIAPFTVLSGVSGAGRENGPSTGGAERLAARTPTSPTPASLVFPLD